MADTIKSALFVDYDSIHRSLAGKNKEAADRLAQRSSALVAALEAGRLFAQRGSGLVRRRVLIRRCYADPGLLGKNRLAFIAGGFEVIDCPVLEGHHHGSADMAMVLDAIDALDHPTGYDEFIVLSADTDLSPVLLRIRAHSRTAAIYANEATSAAYRAIADAVVEEALLLQMLSGDEAQVAASAAPAPAADVRPRAGAVAPPLTDRGEIEVLARKIHNATSIPLFSPRTFADLFRVLAQEIAENGYHFKDTAENVSAKLAATGRNVTRRHVLFVVKGLALKGHVFSTTDTAERLAEVFREQVIYLAGNAGITLDARELGLLPSWIVGRVSPAMAAAEPEPVPPPKPAEEAKPAKKRGKGSTQAPAAAAPKPAPASAPAAPMPAATAAFGNGSARPTKSLEEIKAAATARLAAMKPITAPPPRPATQTMNVGGATPRRESQPAVRPTVPIAPPRPTSAPARPAMVTPPSRPASNRPAAPPLAPAATARPAASRLSGSPGQEQNKEALESSILAAIAQAVDVLVEDSGGAPPGREAPAPSIATPTPQARPEPVPSDGDAGGDIGDEIQRIIASYSRARQQGEQR